MPITSNSPIMKSKSVFQLVRAGARPLAIAMVSLLAANAAQATALYWDLNQGAVNSAVPLNGIWNGYLPFWTTSATGTGGTAQGATTSSDDLFFSSGSVYTTGTVSLAGSMAASSISFDDNIVVTLAGGASITLGGTGSSSGVFILSGDNQANTLNAAIILANAASTIQNAGTGVLTLSGGISGSQNLVLNNNSTTAGGITVSTGLLNNSGTVTNTGSGTGSTIISSTIGTNVSGVIQNSTSSGLTLSGANVFTADTTVTSGILTLGNNLALQSSALDTSGAGTVTLSGATTPVIGGLKGSTALASVITSGWSSATAFTLNLGTGITDTYSGAIGNGSGSTALTKTGLGTQVLSGANTFSGTVTLNAGTLQIGDGSVGSLNGTTGMALTFGGSGLFRVDEAADSNQGMGALSFSAGDGTVQSTYVGTPGTNVTTLTFGTCTRTAGATANFVASGGTNGTDHKMVMTQAAGYIDQGTFFGGSNYAWMDASNTFVRGINYASDPDAYTTSGIATIPTTGVAVGGGTTLYAQTTGAVTAQGTATFATLNIAGDYAFTLDTGATLTVNGLLKSGNTGSPTVISGGTAIQPAASAEWVIRTDQAGDSLSLSTPLAANGGSLTKSGAGTLTLTGTGATGAFTMDGGSLHINNGNTLTSASVTTGGGNSTTMTVTGTNSKWTDSGALTIGNAGCGNTMALSAGGNLSCTAGIIGSLAQANNNAVTIDGTDSKWTGTGTLTLGNSAHSNFNSLTVSNAGSANIGSQALTVGNSGSFNSLTIQSGGTVVCGALNLGNASGSQGNSVLVTGTSTQLTASGALSVGTVNAPTAANRMVVNSGAQVTSAALYVGRNGNAGVSNNTLTIDGTNTKWTGTGAVNLDGVDSVMTVSGGATASFTGSGQMFVGKNSGASSRGSSLIVDGTGSLFEIKGGTDFSIGNQGANNQVLIQNGGKAKFAITCYVNYHNNYYANSPTNSMTVTGTGSEWIGTGTAGTNWWMGNGVMNVFNGGAVSSVNDLFVTNYSQVYLGDGNSLSTISANSVTLASANGQLTFNNGKLVALATGGNLVSGLGVVTLNGPAYIDTATFSTTISSAIGGTGSFTKQGTGTLALTGANNYSGDTTLTDGTLTINGTWLADTSTVTIAADAKLVLLTGAGATDTVAKLVLDGVTMPGGTYNASTPTYGAYFTGSTGSLVVSGTGYKTWANAHGLVAPDDAPDADPDHDGLANALEFVLGGEPNPARPNPNSVSLLPVPATNLAGDLVFTFPRTDLSEGSANVTFQWSTDLSFPSANDVPVFGVDSGGTPGVDVTVEVTEGTLETDPDTIVITIPAAKAPGGKVFGRLHVTVP